MHYPLNAVDKNIPWPKSFYSQFGLWPEIKGAALPFPILDIINTTAYNQGLLLHSGMQGTNQPLENVQVIS